MSNNGNPQPQEQVLPDSINSFAMTTMVGRMAFDETCEELLDKLEKFRINGKSFVELTADSRPIYVSRALVDSITFINPRPRVLVPVK